MSDQKDETQYGTITYVRLPEEVRQQIEQLAKEETRTISAQIVVLLRKALALSTQSDADDEHKRVDSF